jgi:hypothetical protein
MKSRLLRLATNRKGESFGTLLYLIPVGIYFYGAFVPSQDSFRGISQNRFLNSDTLAFVDYSKSIFINLENPFSWFWGTHWFLFPDLIVEGINLRLGSTDFSALYSIGILNYSVFTLAMFFLLKKNILLTGTFVGIYGLLGQLGYEPFSDIWLAGMHTFYMSSIVLLIFSTTPRRYYWIRLSVIALLSFSNELFFIVFVLAFLISLSPLKLIRSPIREFKSHKNQIIEVFISGLSCLVGLATLSNHYVSYWNILPSETGINALSSYITSNNIILFFFFINSMCVLRLFYALLKNRFSRQETRVTTGESLIIAGVVIALVPLFSTNLPWVPRYATFFMLFTLPLAIQDALRFRTSNNVAKKIYEKTVSIILVVLLLTLPIFAGRVNSSTFASPPNESCIINYISTLKYEAQKIEIGAGYWEARKFNKLVTYAQRTMFHALDPYGDKYQWMTKKQNLEKNPTIVIENTTNPWFEQGYLDSLRKLRNPCSSFEVYATEQRRINLTGGRTFIYNRDSAYKLNETWHQSEDWGTWGQGKSSYLLFDPIESFTPRMLRIKLTIPGQGRERRLVEIIQNDSIILKSVYLQPNETRDLLVSLPFESRNYFLEESKLTFRVDKTLIPSSVSNSSDSRVIGVGLISIGVF